MDLHDDRASLSERDLGEQERNELTAGAARPMPVFQVRPGTINGLPWGEYVAREYVAPHRIGLYDVGGGDSSCGLIVPASSGYLWLQQTSGLLCTQRDLEGIYVGCCMDTRDDREAAEAYRAAHPEEVAATEAWFRERMPELAAFREAYAASDRPLGVTAEEADQLDALLREARLPLSIARESLERITEAWVWVRVASDVTNWEHEFAHQSAAARAETEAMALPTSVGYRFQTMLAALAGMNAVLTWENCD